MRQGKRNSFYSGFTVIELLIGMSLGAILILGLVQAFTLSRTLFVTIANITDLNENMLYAYFNMQQSAVFAGHAERTNPKVMGCYDNSQFYLTLQQPAPGINTLSDCTATALLRNSFYFAFMPSVGCFTGNPGADSLFWARTPDCVCNNNCSPAAPNPNARFVYELQTLNVAPAFNVAVDANGNNTLTIKTQGSNNTNFPVLDCTGNPVPANTMSTQVYSISNDPSICTKGGTPCLICTAMANSITIAMIATNVSNMQVYLGQDMNGDGVAVTYSSAPTSPVIATSARVSLLFSTGAPILNKPQGTNFNISGPTVPTDNKYRKRADFTLTTAECYPLYRQGCPGVMVKQTDNLGTRFVNMHVGDLGLPVLTGAVVANNDASNFLTNPNQGNLGIYGVCMLSPVNSTTNAPPTLTAAGFQYNETVVPPGMANTPLGANVNYGDFNSVSTTTPITGHTYTCSFQQN